jgi:hypothetical protein
MALTRRCDDLTTQPAKRVVLVALNAARRDGRDDVEAGDTDAACEASLMQRHEAPEYGCQLDLELARGGRIAALVLLECGMQLSERDAVGDR